MGVIALVTVEVEAMPDFPSGVGTGSVLPVTVSKTTAAAHTRESFNVPDDVPVTIYLWGGAGGGAGGTLAGNPGGGGGGGCGFALVELTAEQWATVTTIELQDLGEGGAGNTNGTANGDTTINTAGDPLVTITGGAGGLVAGGVGGAGGVVTVAEGVEVIVSQDGADGATAVAAIGGAGGRGAGPGGGTGGAGGAGTGLAGGMGTAIGSGGGGGGGTNGTGANGRMGKVTAVFNLP